MPKEHYGEEKDKPAEVEWETVNRASALWTRPRTEIKDEEYQEFYKHIGHDFENPLAWSHNKVEGKLEYTSLLYVPGNMPSMLQNIPLFQCDAVLIDLEDAVPYSEKDAARILVRRFLEGYKDRNKEILVRINGLDTKWALDDLKTSAEDVNLNYEMRLSELQDLDWLSAISSFTQHKMQLDAAQTTFQQTSQMSLFSML